VREVRVDADGVSVRTRRAACRLDLATDRFACIEAPPLGAERPALLGMLDGHRVTVRLSVGGARYVGTAGGGVYLDGDPPRRLTPDEQLCSNHVTDVVAHEGLVWIGTFDDGLCVLDDGTPRRVATPFRMVNDLASTPRGLFVATSDGLFVTRDGRTFTRHRRLTRAITGLAFDGHSLWVSAVAALHRLRVTGGPPTSSIWLPGHSTAVQDVAVAPDGTVWLATEDRGAVRLRGDDVTLFDRAAGLPTSWTLSVDVGPDGTAWVGTLRHGLVAITPDGHHRRVPIPDDWLLAVRATDDGRVFVGTQGGAFEVSAAGGEDAVRALLPLPDRRVHEVQVIGDALYVGTEGGLLIAR
jgi:ligand-binding sensor domain-containing protein